MIPRRRTRPRMMAPKPDSPIRCQGHLKFVRGFNCVCAEIDPTGCAGKIEAAHVRRGTDGGIGSKPGDNWTYPGCSEHHGEQHRIGEQSFEKKYRLNLKQIAEKLWRISPHRLKWEAQQTSSERETQDTQERAEGKAHEGLEDSRPLRASTTTTPKDPNTTAQGES